MAFIFCSNSLRLVSDVFSAMDAELSTTIAIVGFTLVSVCFRTKGFNNKKVISETTEPRKNAYIQRI